MNAQWNKGSPRPKREKTEIIADLLRAVRSEEARFTKEGAILTRVQYRIRVPYSRFRAHLDAALQGGLITMSSRRLFLTRIGAEFLESYDKVLNLVDRVKSEETPVLEDNSWA